MHLCTQKSTNKHVVNHHTSSTQGNISLEKSARRRPYDWLPEQGWEDVIKLTTVLPDVFGSLADDIERNEKSWQEVGVMCTYMIVHTCYLYTEIPRARSTFYGK